MFAPSANSPAGALAGLFGLPTDSGQQSASADAGPGIAQQQLAQILSQLQQQQQQPLLMSPVYQPRVTPFFRRTV